MIPVYKNSKIYVVCPAKAATGGPELLHQLVKILREDMNIESFIMYYPSTSNPVHPEYEKYQVPYVFQDQVEDDRSSPIFCVNLFWSLVMVLCIFLIFC